MSDWQKQMAQFDDLEKDLQKITDAIGGNETKTFLKKQGKKFQKKVQATARRLVKTKTGKYIEGIKNGKVYVYDGGFSTRVYSGARHARLIEYGHWAVAKGGKRTDTFVEGRRVFEKSKDDFEDEFFENVEMYLDELYKKNGF